jgi:hypothetical protein
MCIYGIFRDDLLFNCFQKTGTTISKEETSNNKHATTQVSTTNSNIRWDDTIYKCFIKKIVAIMPPITKLTRKTDFSLDIRMSKGLRIELIEVY